MIEFEGLTFNNEDEVINFLWVENSRLKNRFARAEQEYKFRIREFKESYEKQLFKVNEEKQNLYHTWNAIKRRFAINELEKVKIFLKDGTSIKEPDYTISIDFLDKQIKKLKGNDLI